MRLLIFEPHAIGHRGNYLRWLAKAATSRGWEVVIATTESASAHPTLQNIETEFAGVRIHMIRNAEKHRVHEHPSFLRLILNDLAAWTSLRTAMREVRRSGTVDAVVLPYAEYYFYSLAAFGAPFRGTPWCAISMRLSLSRAASLSQAPMPRQWRFAARMLARPKLRALFFINPSASDVPRIWLSPAKHMRLRYLPDPAEDSSVAQRYEARAALGMSESSIAILIYGWIDGRKGADALIDVLSSNPGLEDFVVILAGEQSAETRDLMKSPIYRLLRADQRLIVLDRFILESEQSALFAAADIIWLGYRNHLFMSGVLVLAGRAGLPVLGTRDGEIGWLVEKHELGVVAAIDRPAEVLEALLAMRDATTRAEMGERGRRAFAAHTVENFGDTVLGVFDAQPRER